MPLCHFHHRSIFLCVELFGDTILSRKIEIQEHKVDMLAWKYSKIFASSRHRQKPGKKWSRRARVLVYWAHIISIRNFGLHLVIFEIIRHQHCRLTNLRHSPSTGQLISPCDSCCVAKILTTSISPGKRTKTKRSWELLFYELDKLRKQYPHEIL